VVTAGRTNADIVKARFKRQRKMMIGEEEIIWIVESMVLTTCPFFANGCWKKNEMCTSMQNCITRPKI
jgi:hypothetical protein